MYIEWNAMYKSTKTYGHEVGLSCCFRQWRANHSHCSLLHGYAIGVKLEFEANKLDARNWVVDFGGLSEVKDFLKGTFDHTLVIAQDDPELDTFIHLDSIKVAKVVVLDNVGCEAFAEYIHSYVDNWLVRHGLRNRVKLKLVEVREHGANSAIYEE